MQRRNTIQKKLVLEHAKKLSGHPSAEEVYKSVYESYPGISKATVYRNLHTLCSEGQLTRLSDPKGADRYDMVTDGHYHAICRGCGEFIDLGKNVEINLDLNQETLIKNNIDEYSILFKGICKNCK